MRAHGAKWVALAANREALEVYSNRGGCWGVPVLPLLKKRKDDIRRALIACLYPTGRNFRSTAVALGFVESRLWAG